MVKCDVCGKQSMVPENLGGMFICKVCFMKINGPLWKNKQYEKRDEVEKQWVKVTETARKHNFPENVIAKINDYFREQAKSMVPCDVCGSSVQNLNPVGSAKLCKRCFSKIDTEEWQEKDYSDNEDVEKNRKKILKIANKQKFPPKVISGINEYFDGKIQKGLIDVVYGEYQELRVFETYCVLRTYGSFDEDELAKRYAKLLRKSNQGGGLISNAAAQALVAGVLGGGLVKAGMSLVTSAVTSVAVDAIAPNRMYFNVKKGTKNIDYSFYDIVEFQKVLSIGIEDELGYMKFRSSQQAVDVSNELIFFFTNNYTAEKMYNYICEQIVQEKKKHMEKSMNQASTSNISVADEIFKFKNLLDIGVITEDEFNEKKKELLKM